MSNIQSGEFCRYTDHGLDDAVGMVLRTSSNERTDENGDPTTEDFVEVVGPLPVRLLPAAQVRAFDEDKRPDPNTVTGSSAGNVGRKNRPQRDPVNVPTDTEDQGDDVDPLNAEEPVK